MLVKLCCKQKTAYEMRISDWSSDVCSSDLRRGQQADDLVGIALQQRRPAQQAMLAVTRRDGPRRCPAPGKGSHRPHPSARPRARHRLAELPTSPLVRSEEHTSELQSIMRISYAVFRLKKNKKTTDTPHKRQQ